MHSSDQPTQSSSTSTSTEPRRATTAPSQQPQPQSTSSSQQQSSSYGTGSRLSEPKPQQPRTAAAEPYPTQESTWWEVGASPHPSRAEEGFGPGPGQSGQRQAPAEHRTMYGTGQDQSGQYGCRDQRRDEQEGVINWNKVAKIICAVLLPPLGVFLETGCDKSFAINVLLTILGYIPGIIHAIYVITTD